MNWKTLRSLLVCVLVHSLSASYYRSGNANAFIDSILASVLVKYNHTLDPFHIPDRVIGFQQRVGLITFGAQLNLTKGTITGLSHMYRSGNSSLNSDSTGYMANIMFGNKNLHIHHKGEVSLMDVHTLITLETDVGQIGVTTEIGLGANGEPVINMFNIDDLEDVRVKVHTPVFIFDPLIDLITQEFIKVFKSMIKEQISKIVKDMIGKELQNFKMPDE